MEQGFLADLVSYRIRLVQIAAYKDFEERAKKTFGSAPRYFGLLQLIEANPGLSQARLADEIHLVRSSLVPILDKLQAEGLVERRSSPAGRRSNAVWLTARGKSVLASLRPVVAEHEKRLTEGFSGVQKTQLLALLNKVDENLRRQKPPATWHEPGETEVANATACLSTASDLDAIEALGVDRFLRQQTPFEILKASAAARPDAVALHYLTEVGNPARDQKLTYRELLNKVSQAANLFRRLGVGADQSVALLMPHIPQAQIALWGAEAAARACPVNGLLRADHLVSILREANAKVAVVCGANRDISIWSQVLPAIRDAGCVTHVLHADAEFEAGGSDGCFEDLIAAESEHFDASPDASSIAACFHTGGTTGAPKLARHTHRNQAFVAQSAAAMYDLQPTDLMLNGFPLFHVAGAFVYGLCVLAAGGTILIPTRLGMRNRDFMATLWRQVEQYRITCIGAVPTVISACNSLPVDADISSLRLMLTGGSPLPTELAEAFERNTGKPVRNLLGMTECAGIVTIEPFHGRRVAGSTGLRLPFTEVQAFRSQDGTVRLDAPCNPGETGVLALKGPNVGPGYTDSSRNPGTFDSSGWLISGDLGHVDAEGRVYVTGRAKDVIIRGGHNIDPSAIEEALLKHPDVAMAAAIGQPDAYAGELPVAFVTLKNSGRQVSGDELRDFVDPLVAEPAARPKRVTILDELPLTPIGKIYKPALRAIAAREAITEALCKAGFETTGFKVEAGEGGATILLLRLTDEEKARGALLGMPLKYAFRFNASDGP
jgi:fatty-acyl-CoA synthase